MSATLLAIALAATLAGAVTKGVNDLSAARKRRRLVGQQAEKDRLLRTKNQNRIRQTLDRTTGENAERELDDRVAQNIASIEKTREATARPPASKGGVGGFKGRISSRTAANQKAFEVANAIRVGARNKNLGRFLAQGNNQTDLAEIVRTGGQDLRTLQNNRIGEFNAATAGIQGVRPNVGIDILSKVLSGIGAVTGLAAGIPSAASSASSGATTGANALGTGTTGFANAVNPLATVGTALPANVAPASFSSLGFTPGFLTSLQQAVGNPRRGFSIAGGIR